MDDVSGFEHFVHQGNVAVGVVYASTGCCCEVVVCSDGCSDDQVVDDFTIDFGNHFVCHQVGHGFFSVDVVDSFEVLCSFNGPGGFELAAYGCYRVAVDAHGYFWLEWVRFQVVFIAYAGYCAGWEAACG